MCACICVDVSAKSVQKQGSIFPAFLSGVARGRNVNWLFVICILFRMSDTLLDGMFGSRKKNFSYFFFFFYEHNESCGSLNDFVFLLVNITTAKLCYCNTYNKEMKKKVGKNKNTRQKITKSIKRLG